MDICFCFLNCCYSYVPRARLRICQSTTQYRNDKTMITRAIGQTVSAEEFVDDFFGGEYKYSNRW